MLAERPVRLERPKPFEDLDAAARDRFVLVVAEQARRARTSLYELIDQVDRSMSYRDDGHVSVAAWVRAVLNCSGPAASRLVAVVRMLRVLPTLADAVYGGEIGDDQLDELLRIFRNRRCREALIEHEAFMARLARTMDVREFSVACARFVAWADPDGTHRSHENAHDSRGVSASIVGTDFQFHAHGGAVDGAAMIEILDGLVDAEFQADWAELVEAYGPDAPACLMRRTHQQRLFDAFRKMFDTTAAVDAPATPRAPHVDFVIDLAVFEAAIRRAAGLTVDDDDEDLATILSRRCQTGTGVPVDPNEVIAAALIGNVRRVVLDSAGIVVDAGRTRRLFSPQVASIVRSLQSFCGFSGCDRPGRRCQIDHRTPWPEPGGETDIANADGLCDHHNRHKHRSGFHTYRDAAGRWHTYRPDGTEIAPREPGLPPP